MSAEQADAAGGGGFGVVPRHLRGKLTATQIAVYVALTWRVDEAGGCFPSHATIAGEAGCSVSTAQRALNRLAELGLVIWIPRYLDAGGQTSNRYELVLTAPPTPPAQADGSVTMTGEAGHSDRGGRSSRPGGSVTVTDEREPDEREPDEESTPRSAEPPAPALEPEQPATEPVVEAEPDPPARPDVEQLCVHLADLIEANGSKRPTITKQWRDAARLMLDRDDRGLDKIHDAIDWCQADEFWRSNILSMPTLRKQYDRLRLAAKRAGPRGDPRQKATDDMFDRAMTRAQRREAELGGPP